jgi:nucleotide-binding universal stress UspA family protein
MEQTGMRGTRPRKVLLGTDASAASRAALVAVAGLAVGGATEVVVLHVADPGHVAAGRALVDDVTLGLVALAVNARAELRVAPPDLVAEAIAAVAAEAGARLVALGSRVRGDLSGLHPGSVARGVLERVSSPVLLARAGRRGSVRHRRVLVAVTADCDIGDLIGATAAVAGLDARVLVVHSPVLDRDGARIVHYIVCELRRQGIHARARFEASTRDSAEEIVRQACEYAADVIVTGPGTSGGPVPAVARRDSRSNGEARVT